MNSIRASYVCCIISSGFLRFFNSICTTVGFFAIGEPRVSLGDNLAERRGLR